MQAGIMPARQPDSLPMLPLCHSQSKASVAAADELLSQCTTEWSRYFIASRIAPCSRYTAALAADLSPQQCLQPTQFSLPMPTPAAAKFRQDDLPSSWASSPSTSLSTSPAESGYSDGALGSRVEATASVLRKVASCAVTAREKSRKRVQFADEVGQALTRIKILGDPLETEAHCATEVSAISAGQQQYHQIPGLQAEPQLQLRCKFSQPISRYIVFRESVDRNLVSLSLIHLDFSTIRGAIAVKNVSFNKRVFARFSFDSWCSFRDVEATYNSSEGQQDNFTFSVLCPADQTVDVQFCVCFECDSGTLWDNNGTENYRVAVSRAAADPNCGYTKDFKPNFGSVSEFSEFTAWEHFPDRVYY